VTLQERFDAAQARSIKLYLERQSTEAARQQIVLLAQQIDLALVELDGELKVLTTLIAEAKSSA
jgi:hypothetical protein